MKIEWDTYHANPQSSVYTVLAFLVLLLSLNACQTGTRPGNTLFQLLDPVQTGVEFNNTLEETHQMNVVIYQDFYSGGGVAIGDINNDDWPDLFFTGNTAPARLYLNNGDFTFRDITESAGLAKMGKGWYTGTT
ncbi:MAG: FG-GAP-like repeat-containing protein, partial [Cyclobacteriaceae bacterium]